MSRIVYCLLSSQICSYCVTSRKTFKYGIMYIAFKEYVECIPSLNKFKSYCRKRRIFIQNWAYTRIFSRINMSDNSRMQVPNYGCKDDEKKPCTNLALLGVSTHVSTVDDLNFLWLLGQSALRTVISLCHLQPYKP